MTSWMLERDADVTLWISDCVRAWIPCVWQHPPKATDAASSHSEQSDNTTLLASVLQRLTTVITHSRLEED